MYSYQGVTIKIFEKDNSIIHYDCELYRSGPLTLKGANESIFLDYPYAGPPRLTQSVKKNVGKMAGGKTYDRAVFSVKAHEIKRFKRIVVMILDKVDDCMKPSYTHEYNLRFVIARALNEANIRKMKRIHIPTISLGCDKLLSFCIVMQAICIYFESCGSTGIKEISILCSDKEEYNSIVEFMEGKTILQPEDVAGFHRLRTFVEKKTLKCEEDSIPRRRLNMGVAYATFVNNGYFEKRMDRHDVQDSSKETVQNPKHREPVTVKSKGKIQGVSISPDVDMESEKEEEKDSTSSDSEEYDPNAERKKKQAIRQRTRTLKKRSETREGSVTSIASIESVRSKNAERQRKYREKRKRENDEAEVERRRLSDLERQRNLRTKQSEDTPAEIERRRLLELERIGQIRTRQSEDDPAEVERRRLMELERKRQLRTRQSEDDPAEVERRRLLELERKRQQRIRQSDQLLQHDSDDEPQDIDDSITVEEPHYLGERNNLCVFCDALHFAGDHRCCQKGKVFVPPFPKLPDPIFRLLYDVNRRQREFLSKILQYNSFFSFASLQYSSKAAAPHGVQVAKVEGTVRGFASAVWPNNRDNPKFANYYVYEGAEAMEERLRHPYMRTRLDDEIVRDLTACITTTHPFARFYKTMGDLMREEEAQGLNPLQMRLRIVDPKEYEKKQDARLQGHSGIYATHQTKDYVAIFYTTAVDQDTLPKGLVIYPKLGNNVPRPLFSWQKQTNSLCYPVMFPRGEPGFYPGGYYRDTPLLYHEQLRRYVDRVDPLGTSNIEASWDSDHEEPHHLVSESDPNLEAEVEDSDNNDYDAEFNRAIPIEEISPPEDQLRFVDRGGERYPVRIEVDPDAMDTDEHERRRQRIRDDPGRNDELDSGSDDPYQGEEGDEEMRIPQGDSQVDDNLGTEENSDVGTDVNMEGNVNEESDAESDVVEDIIEGRRRRLNASLREWMLYVSQDRRRFRNRITAAGKLGQLFTIDIHSRIMSSRMGMIRKHHTEFMTSTRKRLLESFQRAANRHGGRMIGCVTTIPASVPGSPRYLQKKYEDAVAMCNKLGKPDLFITFTANVNWPEIKENIPPGHTWADHPFLLNEVFQKKKDKLIRFIIGKPIAKGSRIRRAGRFGRVRWFTYSIEFQQRGPPHMHLIVSLVNHIKTVRQVDAVCSAELPVLPNVFDRKYEKVKKLRDSVETYMIHTPCEGNTEAYCNQDKPPHWKTCRKRFPKENSEQTEYGDRDYPALKRPKNGEYVDKIIGRELVRADNRYVVPYNKDLLMLMQSHVNVEVISSIKVLKYIFKYLFKGFDRALVECVENVGIEGGGSFGATGEMTITGNIIHPKNLKLPVASQKERLLAAKDLLRSNNIPIADAAGNPTLVYDETRTFLDLRAVTAPEAAWDIAGFERTAASHTVVTTYSHLPHEETVHYEIGADDETLREIAGRQTDSRFTAWFKLNSGTDEEALRAQELTYDELPQYFKFENGKWRERRRDWSHNVVGQLKFVRPRYMESFAVRLLAQHQKGVKSFEELRTIDGILYPTFVDAAKALRLMNNEVEWDLCLQEASTMQNPTALRRMFISILLYCAPANPLELWETHKENFFNTNQWSVETKTAHALFHIQSGLRAHGMELANFHLPAVTIGNLPSVVDLVDDSHEAVISPTIAQKKGKKLFEELTDEQKAVVTAVTQAVASDEQCFFIEGIGGCGKTKVYQTIYYMLEGEGFKTLCVAHTGVAASLLPNGQTAHRAFGIPLTVEEGMTCKAVFGSEHETFLDSLSCILWDEATMTDRRIYDAVDRYFQDLKGNQRPFGGVNFVFGGDWRQTLPIVTDVHGPGVIPYTLTRSAIWPRLKIMHLTKNMRAAADPEYAEWIKKIGEGSNDIDDNDNVELIDCALVDSERALIDRIYGEGRVQDRKVTSNSCILTVDNQTSLEINEKVLKKLPGQETMFLSRDEYDPQRGFSAILPELYEMITPSGMPPHRLPLKVGAVVILLRNLNVFRGLCNGLRMWITEIGDEIIKCEPINGSANTPKVILLHRMAMTPTHAMSRELSFVRWQFPIRLAYAMTINKAQGQTLEKVGLLLRTPVFTHGQLYVAVSRVRDRKSIIIYNSSTNDNRITRNVVYPGMNLHNYT